MQVYRLKINKIECIGCNICVTSCPINSSNKFNVSPRQISLELKNLESIELIQKRIAGKQHYYSVNTQHPIFKELQNIFIKTIGIKEIIRKHLVTKIQSIDFSFIYGSLAKGDLAAKSDIDLIVEFEENTPDLYSIKQKIKKEIQSKFNLTVDICREKYIKPIFKTQILSEARYS